MRRTNIEYMATYKKRGYKPKTKAEKVEAIEENSTTAEVFNTLDEGASKAEEWVVKNQKYIFIIVAVAIIGVLGFLGYNKYIQEPKESKAMNDMFQAQQYFDRAVNESAKDSLYSLALEGGEGKFGMLDIINEYGSTNAGNLANYYAGMSYLNLKDYQNAIKYLSDFSSSDEVLNPMSKGGIGDAFAQLNQLDDALDYYEKAAKASSNSYTASMYLYKAGTTALELGKNQKALDIFNRIKSEFPDAVGPANIDAFIGKAEAAVNN